MCVLTPNHACPADSTDEKRLHSALVVPVPEDRVEHWDWSESILIPFHPPDWEVRTRYSMLAGT